jgi:hypothetical protein
MIEWTKESIKENLQNNDTWVIRGVVAIYNLQTSEEQRLERTKEHNGVGFNCIDGDIMSSFATQIIQWNNDTIKKFHTPLSKKQLKLARKKILKYVGQLTNIANGEL